jgi:hypothetical protein
MSGEETIIRVGFPDLDSPTANEEARHLLSELRQNPEIHRALNSQRSMPARDDRELQDFGASLVLVLGTPAIITLAGAIKAWVERRGRTTIQINDVKIENVRSRDAATIIHELEEAISKGSKA